jgi:DHA2 family multidrug resistance protein
MMRQLGGSWYRHYYDIITRFSQKHRVDLIANLDGSSFEVQQRIMLLQKGFMAKGLQLMNL